MPRLPGAPADDGSAALDRRSPSVQLSLTLPGGDLDANPDPVKNTEWETLRLATYDLEPADFSVPALPAGAYRVDLTGLDLNNLLALRPRLIALGVDPQGRPVALLPPRERPIDS